MADKKKNLFNDEMPDGANAQAEYLAKHGVTSPWLANLLSMDRQVVNQKLADCPKLKKKGKTSGSFYDIFTALQHLIPPLVDWDEWIKTAKKSDMPAKLRKEYHDAKSAEIDYMIKAGLLFHAADIERQTGLILTVLKSKFQTAPAEIEKNHALSPEHIDALHEYLDDILMSVRDELKVFARNNKTASILADDEDVAEAVKPITRKDFLDGLRAKIKAKT